MDLAEHIQFAPPCLLAQGAQLGVTQGRHDQQNRIGTRGPCFYNLERVDGEVLAQTRNRHSPRSLAQRLERALKEALLRKHAQHRGTRRFQLPGQCSDLKIRTDQTLRRRCPLQLGDDRRPVLSALAQRLREAARPVLGGEPLQFRDRHQAFPLRYMLTHVAEDLG